MTQRTCLSLQIAIAVLAICGTTHAQTLIGSPGAGWQTWTTATDQYGNPLDLNDNGAPYWDVTWGASNNNEGSPADKNAGFCLTSTGDCQGIGSALVAPGPLAFWGMPYDSANDSGGARDNTVYFKNTVGTMKATLLLNASANPAEVNEFGWFETNPGGTTVVKRHMLFQGSGEPTGTLKPDPVGKTVVFTPTTYFGFYYSDVSEPTPDTGVQHGCYAYTLFNLDEPRCTQAVGEQGDHDFVVFATNPGSSRTAYWIVGEDPAGCPDLDGDCNLTMVRVSPLP